MISFSPRLQQSHKPNTGWSAERRAKHAAAIRRWRPWLKSTGPKTRSGKARSAMNSLKHGDRSRSSYYIRKALTRQAHFVRKLALYTRLKKKNIANELLKDWRIQLLNEGREASIWLILALEMLKLQDRAWHRPANHV